MGAMVRRIWASLSASSGLRSESGILARRLCRMVDIGLFVLLIPLVSLMRRECMCSAWFDLTAASCLLECPGASLLRDTISFEKAGRVQRVARVGSTGVFKPATNRQCVWQSTMDIVGALLFVTCETCRSQSCEE